VLHISGRKFTTVVSIVKAFLLSNPFSSPTASHAWPMTGMGLYGSSRCLISSSDNLTSTTSVLETVRPLVSPKRREKGTGKHAGGGDLPISSFNLSSDVEPMMGAVTTEQRAKSGRSQPPRSVQRGTRFTHRLYSGSTLGIFAPCSDCAFWRALRH
jgi:hypothetical protein